MSENKLKIKGEPVLWEDFENQTMTVRWVVTIPTMMMNDSQIKQLQTLGFKWELLPFDRCKLMLPPYWAYLTAGKLNDIAIDHIGQSRILFNPKLKIIEILRKFEAGIRVIRDSDKNIKFITIFVQHDGEDSYKHSIFPKEFSLILSTRYNNDEELFLKHLTKIAEEILDRNYPKWRDPLEYW